MVKRKTPIRHKVGAHKKRDGTRVQSYTRGHGTRKISKSRVVGRKRETSVMINRPTTKLDILPGTNIPILWHHYAPKSQQILWLTPEEYLTLAAPPLYGESIDHPYGFLQSSVDGLDKAFKKGEELYSLRLDVDEVHRKIKGHEGRHRAAWAHLNNIPYLPVVMWHENTHGDLIDTTRPIPYSELKPQLSKGYVLSTHPEYGELKVDRSAWDVLLGNTAANWDNTKILKERAEEKERLEQEAWEKEKKRLQDEKEAFRKELMRSQEEAIKSRRR